jgi:hypothetical protein
MHEIRSIRLFKACAGRNLASRQPTEAFMNTPLRFTLDDVLNVLVLFVPVSLLMSASLALAAIG